VTSKRFYVYRILGEMGETVYIGKGTGRRLELQKRRFMAEGEIIRSFAKEDLAFRFEAKLIAKHKPPLNVVSGHGSGKLPVGPHRPYKPVDTTSELFEVAARALNCMRFPQRHFIWFDMLPGFKKFVGALIERFGEEEFARRVRPHGIEMKFQ
jgi:hypothetical protein